MFKRTIKTSTTERLITTESIYARVSKFGSTIDMLLSDLVNEQRIAIVVRNTEDIPLYANALASRQPGVRIGGSRKIFVKGYRIIVMSTKEMFDLTSTLPDRTVSPFRSIIDLSGMGWFSMGVISRVMNDEEKLTPKPTEEIHEQLELIFS